MSTGIYLQAESIRAARPANDWSDGTQAIWIPPADLQENYRDYSKEPAVPLSTPPSRLFPRRDWLLPGRLGLVRSGFSPRSRLPAKTKPRVVLLQGPVGPFFSLLQERLESAGFDAWRISFNAGDRFFIRGRKWIGFAGTAGEWQTWLDSFITGNEVDHIILFGSSRPAHEVARRVAAKAGIHALCLEEGYIRPGFVTAEAGGNNAYSPLAGRMPPRSFDRRQLPQAPRDFQSFQVMCRYGAAYYAIRALFSRPRERQLFHRRFAALVEPFLWARNYWRHFRGRSRDFRTIERLLEIYDSRYFLVPLQVSADSQLSRSAYGWNSMRLIIETLRSFARSAPKTHRLVFKIHPLERGHSNARQLVREIAEALGVGDRVDVVETGSIGLLTRHSAGMITINSTSGLSAIYHGAPLLVIGNALYANEALATCAHGAPDFNAFWAGGPVADVETRRRYLAWIAWEALIPGDFYSAEGMALASDGIVERLRQAASRAHDAILDEVLAQAC
ncbi:capsular polysaccharide export protein [Mesorhizobium sp. J18]|nr:capsular polysaccharide export protein [Mesorhizobium sp. J18]